MQSATGRIIGRMSVLSFSSLGISGELCIRLMPTKKLYRHFLGYPQIKGILLKNVGIIFDLFLNIPHFSRYWSNFRLLISVSHDIGDDKLSEKLIKAFLG